MIFILNHFSDFSLSYLAKCCNILIIIVDLNLLVIWCLWLPDISKSIQVYKCKFYLIINEISVEQVWISIVSQLSLKIYMSMELPKFSNLCLKSPSTHHIYHEFLLPGYSPFHTKVFLFSCYSFIKQNFSEACRWEYLSHFQSPISIFNCFFFL